MCREGHAVSAGSGGQAKQLEELQAAMAQGQSQICQDEDCERQKCQVCRDGGLGKQPPQLPQAVVSQGQPCPKTQGPEKPMGLLGHGRGHQPKRREKNPPSRRGSS